MGDGIVMGLDIASSTGVAEGIPGGAPRLYTKQLILEDDNSPTVGFARAIKWMATRCLAADRPIAIFVEGLVPDTALAGRTQHHGQLMKIGLYACLTGVARVYSIPVIPSNINRVRKIFTGHGGLKGQEGKVMVRRECERLGWTPANNDESDAAACWFYGCGEVTAGALQQRLI